HPRPLSPRVQGERGVNAKLVNFKRHLAAPATATDRMAMPRHHGVISRRAREHSTMTSLLSHRRSAGVLLHPTSLPGPYGIGDLGPGACNWVNALSRARQSWWQILPLGPTGYADSPYQSLS